MFLGIYDYTVILTYISLGISVFGISRALEGDFKVAIFCLALSGLCDMFDGKIARTKKNRTDDEKNFGIQIDSLCDVVFTKSILLVKSAIEPWLYASTATPRSLPRVSLYSFMSWSRCCFCASL